MEYSSVFDIIGPIMVGPSSSHTAGASSIGRLARKIFSGMPEKVEVTFFGSFAKTYKGHGSDIAVAAGLMYMKPSDERLRDSLKTAKEKGMEIEFITSGKSVAHPNTVNIKMSAKGKDNVSVTGESLGGGKINICEINGFDVRLSGAYPTVLVFHKDEFGAVADVSNILAKHGINIGHMSVARVQKGQEALMTIEIDQHAEAGIQSELRKIPSVVRVIIV